jgi:hypothetical protein
MTMLIAAAIAYGFGRGIDANFIHPPSARPPVLYVRAATFTGWPLFLILQSTLVRTHYLRVHRRIGWFGLALGLAMPFVGVATAISMCGMRLRGGDTEVVPFLIVPFFDVFAFAVMFALAFYWRRKPEFHPRLILLATIALTSAAFGRFPASILPLHWCYLGVDTPVLLALARDWIVTRGVYPAYLYGLPLMIVGQAIAIRMLVTSWAAWMRIAHALLG